MRIIYS